MTKFIIALLFAMPAFGYEVPKDAVIKVYTKDGKQIGEMNRSQYKVVKLGTSKTKVVTKYVPLKSVKDVERYKSLIFHAGRGNNGLSTGHDGTNHTVREKEAFVGGVTGCITEKGKGVCLNGFTNETVTIGVKVDFD